VAPGRRRGHLPAARAPCLAFSLFDPGVPAQTPGAPTQCLTGGAFRRTCPQLECRRVSRSSPSRTGWIPGDREEVRPEIPVCRNRIGPKWSIFFVAFHYGSFSESLHDSGSRGPAAQAPKPNWPRICPPILRIHQGIAEHGRRSLPRPPHAVAKPQHPKGAARARACCVRSSPRARRSDMRVGQRIMRGTSRLPATASTSAAAGQTGCRVSSSVWRRIASLTRSSRRMTPARPGAVPRNRSQARCRLA